MTAVESMTHPHLRQTAVDTAARAGVVVRIARTNEEIRRISRLLAEVWGTSPSASPGPLNVLAAIADTDGYVVGAWAADGSLAGASFGVTYLDGGEPCLRSQVTGVLQPRRGVGEAIKRHQQWWAAEHGMRRITWTFDPLVRRNAHFNLDRLRARIVRFVPDFYGPLDDGLNGSDATDRCVVSWTAPGGATLHAGRTSHELLQRDHGALLIGDADGNPVLQATDAPAVLVATPADIVELRRQRPEVALAWRRSVRSAFSLAFDAGLVADLITVDGHYRFRRDEDA